MLKIKDEGIILERTRLEFENEAVLNPACVEKDGLVHMFYRAVRRGNFSSIGYCQLKDNKVIRRLDHPIIKPEYKYEAQGVEDPRIIKLNGVYYLFYTAYDGKNARIAYATSRDLIKFTKKGLVSPEITYDEAENLFRQTKLQEKYFLFESFYKEKHGQDVLLWEKDAFLLPRKINNQFALFHRILPGIQLIYFDDFQKLKDLNFWKKYLQKLGENIVLDPKNWFEIRNVGGGCPPIETERGWLLIYHAVEDTSDGKIYHAAAALLDRDDPRKIIGRLNYPLFSPRTVWEKYGLVNNVVFPTGAIVDGDKLIVYYGASDILIAAKSLSLKELLDEIESQKA